MISLQLSDGSKWSAEKERNSRDDEYTQSLAQRAQEESISNKRREDNAGNHHQNDIDSSVDMVRECTSTTQEGEQDDLGATESC